MATATKTTGSQFEGLLAPRKRPLAESAPVGPEVTAPKSRPSAAKSEPAKSTAKSKNKDYQARTLYLRKKTYTDCDYLLKNIDDPRDMSELVEDLLTEFIAKSKR